MTNVGKYAKDPATLLATSLQKGYTGLRFEQGVPVLERDLNLQSELQASTERAIIQNYIGNGSRFDDTAFKITAPAKSANNFQIGAGTALVGGLEVTCNGTDYNAQKDPDPDSDSDLKPVPSGEPPRTDIVYLDVWLDEEAPGWADIDLMNTGDIQRRTTVRLVRSWRVRVAKGPNASIPAAAPGHAHYKLATLVRKSDKIAASEITDNRVRNLNLAHLVKQLELLQLDVGNIKELLMPSFMTARPFDVASGYSKRIVTLFGRNFHLGNVSVDLITNGINVSAAQLVAAEQPNSLRVQIAAAVTPGDGYFKVTTGMGFVESPTFRVFGSVEWDPVPWAAPDVYKTKGHNLVITGKNLDCPGLVLEISPKAPDIWQTLVYDPASATSTEVTVTLPNVLIPANCKIRASNEASRAIAGGNSNQQWADSPPGVDLLIH